MKTESLEEAERQLAYWQGVVRRMKETEADRWLRTAIEEFDRRHHTVRLNPGTIPPEFTVDGERMNEQQYIELFESEVSVKRS